jgi:hypothetical protein
VADLLKALLGNGSVNTFQHATMEAVFSVEECYSSLLGSTTILATVVFSMRSAPRNNRSVFYVVLAALYNGSLFVAFSTEPRSTRLEIELENWVEFSRVGIPR